MRPTLSLKEPQDAPRVKEAKETVAAALGQPDPSLVPWAMRMSEARAPGPMESGRGIDAGET
jgi:hypothetical protein